MSRVRFADSVFEESADYGKKRRIERIAKEDNSESFAKDHIKKHTLDSDEEDDDREKYEKLDLKRVEGQEDATVEYDGKTKLMAFNMKEDMEEGHFDEAGNFIYDKKEDVIKDAWLDNINWDNVKNKAGKLWEKAIEESETIENENSKVDVAVVYKRLLELINEKEDVGKALRRLNSEKGLSAAEERKRRWAAKKSGKSLEDESSKTVSELTSLADSLISLGHMEAYQLDHTQIKQLLNKIEPKVDGKKEIKFDMFNDDEMPPSSSQTSSSMVKDEISSPISIKTEDTMWEYCLTTEESIKGPISNSKMIKMRDSDYFQDGTIARRVGTDRFYDVKRIDFDLYDE